MSEYRWIEPTIWAVLAAVFALMTLFLGATQAHADRSASDIVPAFYKVFDVGTDWRTERPELPPVGSVHWHTWEELHPGAGDYNWEPLRRDMAAEVGLQVVAPDGSLIPKPVIVEVVNYLSPDGPAGFRDMTPEWVYERMIDNGEDVDWWDGRWTGYVLESEFAAAAMPAYDSPTWRAAMREFVMALGAELHGHPNLAAVIVATGLDAENQPIKAWGGSDWPAIMREQAPGIENAFGNLVVDMAEWYDQAFPGVTVLLNNATGQGRCYWAQEAVALGLGFKHSGLVPDIADHVGYGTYCGSWVPWVSDRPQSTVLVPESKHGLGGVETYVWSLYAALHYRPDAISVHPEYLDQTPPEFLRWVWAQMAGTEPSAWAVLRDKEWPLVDWGSGGVSGKVGPWTRDMVPSGYEVGARGNLPYGQEAIYARQYGRIEEGRTYLSMNLADGTSLGLEPELRLVVLGGDGLLTIRYWTDQGVPKTISVSKGPDSTDWNEVTAPLPGLWAGAKEDIRITGDAMIHLAEIRTDTVPGPTPTPTEPKPTWTPTMTPTRTPAMTLTPTPTPHAWFAAESNALDDLYRRVSALETAVASR